MCTADRHDLESFVEACIEGGVDIVQLRDKTLEARPLAARATLVAEVCRRRSVPFVVNDRPDIALEVGADGVHVGQDDVSAAVARRVLGPGMLVGLSTHDDAELRRSMQEPVDYISAGPVVATPTKPGRPGTGLGYAAMATSRSQRPVFVTGGVSPDSVPAMVAGGARRFVVVRYLVEAADPLKAAGRLRAAIDEALAAVDESAVADPGRSGAQGA